MRQRREIAFNTRRCRYSAGPHKSGNIRRSAQAYRDQRSCAPPLVFPGPERIPGLVQLTAAQRDTGQATVTFHDSRGRTVAYDAGASFAGRWYGASA